MMSPKSSTSDIMDNLGQYSREIGFLTRCDVKFNPLPKYTCANDVYHPSFGYIIDEFSSRGSTLHIALNISNMDINELMETVDNYLQDGLQNQVVQRSRLIQNIEKDLRMAMFQARSKSKSSVKIIGPILEYRRGQIPRQLSQEISFMKGRLRHVKLKSNNSLDRSAKLQKYSQQIKSFMKTQGIEYEQVEKPWVPRKYRESIAENVEQPEEQPQRIQSDTHDWNF